METLCYTIQHIAGINDSYGNPQRLYMVCRVIKGEPDVEVVALYDESYSGYPEEWRGKAVSLPSLELKQGEYRNLKRAYKKRYVER